MKIDITIETEPPALQRASQFVQIVVAVEQLPKGAPGLQKQHRVGFFGQGCYYHVPSFASHLVLQIGL